MASLPFSLSAPPASFGWKQGAANPPSPQQHSFHCSWLCLLSVPSSFWECRFSFLPFHSHFESESFFGSQHIGSEADRGFGQEEVLGGSRPCSPNPSPCANGMETSGQGSNLQNLTKKSLSPSMATLILGMLAPPLGMWQNLSQGARGSQATINSNTEIWNPPYIMPTNFIFGEEK